MGRVQDLVDDVLSEAQFDANAARALRALDGRHRRMVVRSRCYRKTISIGPTVANERAYAVPVEVLEVLEVLVDGVTYGNARHDDIARNVGGYLCLSGVGGVSTRDDDEDGVEAIALIPTPTAAGSTVEILAVCRPPALDVADDTTLVVPEEFDEPLAAGAIGRLLRRVESRPDLAQPHEQEYSDACEELRRQVNRKYRGPGPSTIRVVGWNL